MASNFVRESIFVYDNPITQIDSISLVHAMVQHITNNFDHFSDDFFCKEIGTIQILHLYLTTNIFESGPMATPFY